MLFSHQKEWNSDSWYNIDKPSKHDAKWKNPDRKGHILYDTIYIVSRRGKSLETENRLAAASGWGKKREMERTPGKRTPLFILIHF